MIPGHRRAAGQSLVETALILPVALLLFMAVFDFGRVVIQANALTNAAREGARFAIVHQDAALITQRVQDMMFMGDVSNTADAEFLGYFKPADDGTLGAPCADIEVGCVAVVHARSSWTPITPIVSFLGPIGLEAEAELAVEFVCPNDNVPEFNTGAECPKQP